MSIYKCRECGATDADDDLHEESIGDGYMCNNCCHDMSTMYLYITEWHRSLRITCTPAQRRRYSKAIDGVFKRLGFKTFHRFSNNNRTFDYSLTCTVAQRNVAEDRIVNILTKRGLLK